MKVLFLHRFRAGANGEHEFGGAERQLVDLARGLASRGHEVVLVTFYDGGELISDADRGGVRIISLHKSGRWDVLPFLARLARALRRERPDVTHGYLGLANALLVLMRPVHRGKVVWGVRSSDIDLSRYSWIQRFDAWIERSLSRLPNLIIANSFTGRDLAIARGFPAGNLIVIHNGIDIDRFRPDPDGRERLRSAWGIGQDDILIGRVGRLDPQKDHPTFIAAAGIVAQREPRVRSIAVGVDQPGEDSDLSRLVAEAGIADRFIWAGAVQDMPGAYSALDLSVSSSAFGEGTPNVVAESLACGVPCVVTDVGDSAYTVGEFGSVVPRQDPDALARAIVQELGESRDPAAMLAHVASNFSYTGLVERTERELLALLESRGSTR